MGVSASYNPLNRIYSQSAMLRNGGRRQGTNMKATFAGKSTPFLLMCLAGLFLFIAPQARADENDPPSRVARISDLDGNVSFQPSGTEDWAAAAKNRPVTVGDKLWTDQDSRA